MPARRLYLRIALFTVIVLALAGPATAQTDDYGPVGQAQHRDVLIASDMWSKTPGIMGISLNFADIIAAPDLDSSAKANQSYADARAAVLKGCTRSGFVFTHGCCGIWGVGGERGPR